LDNALPTKDITWLRQYKQSISTRRDLEEQSTFCTSYACAALCILLLEHFNHAFQKRLKFHYDNWSCGGMAVNRASYVHDRTCQYPTFLSINNARRPLGDVGQYADRSYKKVYCSAQHLRSISPIG
jgi:hypothetical protein